MFDKCTRYGSTFKRTSLTGTVRKHMRSLWCFADASDTTQSRLGLAGSFCVVFFEPAEHVSSHLEMAIAELVVSIQQPFNVVESSTFGGLLTSINPEVILPSRHTLRWLLIDLMELMLARVQQTLQSSSSKKSLTKDAWSSSIYHGYIFVTENWLDDKWKLRQCMLKFTCFPAPHTGDQPCAVISDANTK